MDIETGIAPITFRPQELVVTRIALYDMVIDKLKDTQLERMRAIPVGTFSRTLDALLGAFAKVTLELRAAQAGLDELNEEQRRASVNFEDEYSIPDKVMDLAESVINAEEWSDVARHRDYLCDCPVCKS